MTWDSAGDIPAGGAGLRHPPSTAPWGGGNGVELSSALWLPLLAPGELLHLPLWGAGAQGISACHYPCPEPPPALIAQPLLSQPRSFSPHKGEQRGID